MSRLGNDTLKLRPQERLVIAGEGWDLTFTSAEVKSICAMWSAGISVPDMAAKLKRQQEEIAVMIMDLSQMAVIGLRERGVYGGEENRDACRGRKKA